MTDMTPELRASHLALARALTKASLEHAADNQELAASLANQARELLSFVGYEESEIEPVVIDDDVTDESLRARSREAFLRALQIAGETAVVATDRAAALVSATAEPVAYDAARIHSLDGLRAVSIALVMAGHFTKLEFFPGGFGVTVFFVISGFIITHLLLKEIDRTGSIDLKAFYTRRFFRLLPAIVVTMTGVAILQFYVDRDWLDVPRALASIFFAQNYYLNFYDFTGPIGQHWSLAIEEHFYLLFPALLLWLLSTKKPVVRVLILLCLVPLAIRFSYAMLSGFDPDYIKDIVYRSSETRMDSILFGCILAVLARGDTLKRYTGVWMLIGGLMLMIITRTYVEIALFRDTIKFTLQPLAIAMAVAAILYAQPGIIIGLARWVLNSPPMVFLGRISFSAYLTHTAMFHTVRVTLGGEPSWWVLMPAATAATILVSWLSFRFVEQPMIKIGKRVIARRKEG